MQELSFPAIIKYMTSSKCLSRNCKLINLSPIIDKREIFKVGVRLHHSNLTQEKKYLIFVIKNHTVIVLIIKYFHLFHATSQLLLCVIRNKFCILKERRAIRKFVKNCIVYVRASATKKRPSFVTRYDYAGPIFCKFEKGRGATSFKYYISLFI